MPAKRRVGGKLLCYPMGGAVLDQFENLVSVLQAFLDGGVAAQDPIRWIRHKHNLGQSFAKKLFSVLYLGTGLVARTGRQYTLSEAGQALARKPKAESFYEVLRFNFDGVEDILTLLRKLQSASASVLQDAWRRAMLRKNREVQEWSPKHSGGQMRFRLDWLRSLGLVDLVSGRYLLTPEGLRQSSATRAVGALSKSEAGVLSHNDIEDKLTLIGAFFQFAVKKRASISDILSRSVTGATEDRQVDCLWVRFVHFGGKLQYPFEVQMSGNMADAIERLEVVASVIQKAVVVTDEHQQTVMLERLRLKRSPLLDKVVFLTPDDVDKVVSAATIMKTFTDVVFSDDQGVPYTR